MSMRSELLTLVGILAIAVIGLSAWTAWGRFGYLVRSDPSAKLQAESLAGPGLRTVSLAHMTDFAWDQVVFFGPYTSRDAVKKALGFDWSEYEDSVIAYSDLYNLIVFIKSKRVARWWKLRRCAPDIEKPFVGVEVSREDASLLLQNGENCSYLLGPANMRSNSAPHGDGREATRFGQY